jgi:hypothetical protein
MAAQLSCSFCGKRVDEKKAYVELRGVEPGLVRATSIAGRAGLRKQGVLRFCNRQELVSWLGKNPAGS